MTEKKLKEQAVERLLETAMELDRALDFMEMFARFGNSMFDRCFDEPNKKRFFEGLSMMRDSVYARHGEAIRQAFNFACVSDKVRDYSLQKLKERFDPEERFEIMSFLERWGHIPSGYYSNSENKFRDDILEEIKKVEKE